MGSTRETANASFRFILKEIPQKNGAKITHSRQAQTYVTLNLSPGSVLSHLEKRVNVDTADLRTGVQNQAGIANCIGQSWSSHTQTVV